VWWLVWIGIGAVVVGLLVVSWWYDRDARRRGARPLSGGQMGRGSWARDRAVEQDVTQVSPMGMTPRGSDAARDIWRGR
jgi:hypothetical protein